MKTFDLLDIATLVSAVGCGLVAGVFFAFSTSVMKALGSLPPACGIAAMQTINVVIINPWFLVTFFATGAACLYVMIASFLQWPDARAPYGLVGGALYLVGTLLVTVVCNVPRNNTLAATVPSSPDAAPVWTAYLSTWTAWNHVRTVAALAAALALTLALGLRA